MRLFNKDILILYKMRFCPLLTRNQLEEQRILHGLSDTIEIKYLDKRVQRDIIVNMRASFLAKKGLEKQIHLTFYIRI